MDKKTFVLDTNVILHDASCINGFDEHEIAIPITVLEEIDKFKRGNEDIHVQARRFMRALDSLSGPIFDLAGVSRGPGLGNLRVVWIPQIDADIRTAFISDIPDHRILNAAVQLQKQLPERQVVLVSKDINLRMKAKSLGLTAEDYEADKVVAESTDFYTGKRLVQDVSKEELDHFFESPGSVARALVPSITQPVANENFVFKNCSRSALLTFDQQADAFIRVSSMTAAGIQPRNSGQIFALRALLDPAIKLVTIAGRAGSGKTLLALAAALESAADFRQILLARPIVPLSNRDLGFLPGAIQDKLNPYMQPLFDNLNVIRHRLGEQDPAAKRIQRMLDDERLMITPLSYIRGRSLQNTFFIVDEAQNLTPHEVKTIITRAGEGTKIVFTGDTHQIDQPYLDAFSNGLSHLINRMKGQTIYSHVTLEKGERSQLANLASQML